MNVKPHELALASPEMDAGYVQQELGISVPMAAALASRGQYTASQFKRLNADKYDLIVHLLGCGWSKEHIRVMAACAWETVDAISKDAEVAPKIREVSLRIAALCENITEAGLQALLPKAIAGKLTALDLKLICEMGQLMKGLPTSISEQRERVTLADWKEFLREVVEAPSTIGLGSGESLQLGAGAVGGSLGPGAVGGAAAGAGDQGLVMEAEVVRGNPELEGTGDVEAPGSHA